MAVWGAIGGADEATTPFNIQVFARDGECLRLDVLRQDADLVLAATAPGGLTFFNDDKGGAGCPNCPRVTIDPTPTAGWYTVHISLFNSFAPVGSNFTLAYGLYPSGNSNCSGAALAAAAVDDKPAGDGGGGRPFGDSAPPR